MRLNRQRISRSWNVSKQMKWSEMREHWVKHQCYRKTTAEKRKKMKYPIYSDVLMAFIIIRSKLQIIRKKVVSITHCQVNPLDRLHHMTYDVMTGETRDRHLLMSRSRVRRWWRSSSSRKVGVRLRLWVWLKTGVAATTGIKSVEKQVTVLATWCSAFRDRAARPHQNQCWKSQLPKKPTHHILTCNAAGLTDGRKCVCLCVFLRSSLGYQLPPGLQGHLQAQPCGWRGTSI